MRTGGSQCDDSYAHGDRGKVQPGCDTRECFANAYEHFADANVTFVGHLLDAWTSTLKTRNLREQQFIGGATLPCENETD